MLERVHIDAIKRAHPIEDVVRQYGIDLRPSGRALIGRCPFHADGGRPNLHVYPSSSYYCYRCALGGDVLSFIQRTEGISFRAALDRLGSGQKGRCVASRALSRPTHGSSRRVGARSPWPRLGTDERACLAAAAELYANRLLSDPAPLSYLEGRGIDRATAERHRVGYAAGEELVAYLRWRRIPVQAAIRVGLRGNGGRERMAGRVVVPEIRAGQTIWMVGRLISPHPDAPKYLGLPGRKPLLGWESAQGSPTVTLVEGPFDWLTLRSWNLPGLALVGTHMRASATAALDRFPRLYIALDNDNAGRAATHALIEALGARAVAVRLAGVKDVADLAVRPNGHAVFEAAVQSAEAGHRPVAGLTA